MKHTLDPHEQARICVRAARLYRQCGRVAALKYAQARLSPGNLRLYYLSRTLQAAQSIREVNHD